MEGLRQLAAPYEGTILALFIAAARLYGFLASTYVLPAAVSGRMVRGLVTITFALPAGLALVGKVGPVFPPPHIFFATIALEFFKGYLLGYSIGWIFWVIEAVGNIIDNQRGASIATAINPLLGQEASPLGILMSQAILAYFYAVGGMFVVLNIYYFSFSIWPPSALAPSLDTAAALTILTIFQKAVMLSFLLAAPLVVVMFVTEFALAMISRFAPQIQVFILAMPLKSAIVTFMLIFYFKMMMDHALLPVDRFFGFADRILPVLGYDRLFEDVIRDGARPQ